MLIPVKRRVTPKTHFAQTNIGFLRDDGIIYKAYRGDQNGDAIKKLRDTVEKLAQGLRVKQKPVLILVDLSKLGKTTLSARNAEIEFIRALDFDKAAVFGYNFFSRNLIKLIVIASGMGYKIKFFNSEADALDWLQSPNNW